MRFRVPGLGFRGIHPYIESLPTEGLREVGLVSILVLGGFWLKDALGGFRACLRGWSVFFSDEVERCQGRAVEVRMRKP